MQGQQVCLFPTAAMHLEPHISGKEAMPEGRLLLPLRPAPAAGICFTWTWHWRALCEVQPSGAAGLRAQGRPP